MRPWMRLIVALIGLTVAMLRAQEIAANTEANRPVETFAGRPINGEQLEQMLTAAHRHQYDKSAKQLYELELTERLSAARRTRCEAYPPGPEARRALTALADRSLFL